MFWIYFHSYKYSSSSLLGMATYFIKQLYNTRNLTSIHVASNFLLLTDNTWMNILVNIFLWICLAISLRFIPRSEIAGSNESLSGFSCMLPNCSPRRLYCITSFSSSVHERIHLSHPLKHYTLSIYISMYLPKTHKRSLVWIASLVKLLSYLSHIFQLVI